MTDCVKLSNSDIVALCELYSASYPNCSETNWLDKIVNCKNKRMCAYYIILHNFTHESLFYEKYSSGLEPFDFTSWAEFDNWIFLSYCKSPFSKDDFEPNTWRILSQLDSSKNVDEPNCVDEETHLNLLNELKKVSKYYHDLGNDIYEVQWGWLNNQTETETKTQSQTQTQSFSLCVN